MFTKPKLYPGWFRSDQLPSKPSEPQKKVYQTILVENPNYKRDLENYKRYLREYKTRMRQWGELVEQWHNEQDKSCSSARQNLDERYQKELKELKE